MNIGSVTFAASTAMTRRVVVRPLWSKAMMSPRAINDGATGSMITREPSEIVGSIEPPATTAVPIPSDRIATTPMHVAKSATANAVAQIEPSVLTVVLLSIS